MVSIETKIIFKNGIKMRKKKKKKKKKKKSKKKERVSMKRVYKNVRFICKIHDRNILMVETAKTIFQEHNNSRVR